MKNVEVFYPSLPENRLIVGHEPGRKLPDMRGCFSRFLRMKILGFTVFEADYPEELIDLPSSFHARGQVR